MAHLRCIFSLFFIPLVPYPARSARHLPHAGKALSVGNSASPIQPPPLRGTSFHRKEGMTTRAPSLGRGTASATDRVLSQTTHLRRSSSLFFIPLVPYPAHSARHLPLEGKALSVGIVFPHMRVFVLTMRGKRYSCFVAFPIGEGGPRQRWIGCSRKRRT